MTFSDVNLTLISYPLILSTNFKWLLQVIKLEVISFNNNIYIKSDSIDSINNICFDNI